MRRVLFYASVIASFFCTTHTLKAQIENSAYSATGRAGVGVTLLQDYQALGVNPANIAIRKNEAKSITIGLGEMAGSALFQGISPSEVQQYFSDDFFSPTNPNYNDRLKAAQDLSGKAYSASLDIMAIGACYNNDKIGSFAFAIKENFRAFIDLHGDFTQFAYTGALATNFFPQLITNNNDTVANNPNLYSQYFQAPYNGVKAGYNPNGVSMGQVFNNSQMKVNWNREYAIGYGRELKVDDQNSIYAGFSVKYIQSFGYVNIDAKNNSIHGYAAYNPNLDKLDTLLKINSVQGAANSYQPVGDGVGFDFGVTAKLVDHIRLGASLINLGSVTYTKNIHEIRDTTIYSYNYNTDLLGGFDQMIKWEEKKKLKVSLPTQLRLGASFAIIHNRLDAGIDMVIPLNNEPGNFNKTAFAIGGDVYPFRWLRLSTGTSWGGNQASSSQGYNSRLAVPLGIGFIIGEDGTYEIGFATRDITTYFMSQSPYYSAAMGLFRIRI
jgi:hypothetical protein